MAWKEAHQRIRAKAASYEFATYGEFKDALKSASQEYEHTHRNIISSSINTKKLAAPQVFVESAIKQAVDRLQGSIIEQDQDAGAIGKKDIISTIRDVGTILNALKSGGVLREREISRLELLLQDLHYPTIEDGKFQSFVLNTEMTTTLAKIGKAYADKEENQEAIFDEALSKITLPKGWQHVPEKFKGQIAQIQEGMLGVTMTPFTKSAAKLRVKAPPSITSGKTNINANIRLGQLTQGLDQKLFFGVLRYFWYSKAANQDIKNYLVSRYLRAFRQFDDTYFIADMAGKIVQATTPKIEGLAGMGAMGASSKMTAARMPGAGARDIAVRTWIQYKNIPAAQSIRGYLRYAWVTE